MRRSFQLVSPDGPELCIDPVDSGHLARGSSSDRCTQHRIAAVVPWSRTISRFAELVLKPGKVRLYALDLTNKLSHRWVSIEAAVVSGRPFCGEVHDDIFVFDADNETQKAALDLVARDLRQHSIVPVIENSGGIYEVEGIELPRQHLLAYIPSITLMGFITSRAHAYAGTKTVASARPVLRPPLSPHRSGRLPTIVEPATTGEAIAALTPTISRFEPRVSKEMLRLLRNGDTYGRYSKGGKKTHRDHAIQAFVTSAVGACWPPRKIWRVLMKRGNALALKWQKTAESDPDKARRAFERSYLAACRFVKQHPPVSSRVEPMIFIEHVAHHLVRYWLTAFKGRAAKTAFAVFCAHLSKAHRFGTIRYSLSEREIEDFSQIQKRSTVRRANTWLESRGLITRLNPRADKKGGAIRISRFSLDATPFSFGPAPETTNGPCCFIALKSEEESGRKEWANWSPSYDPSLRPLPEVFATGGEALGFSAMLVWIVADDAIPSEVAARLGITAHVALRHLRWLKRVGLALRDGERWQAVRSREAIVAAARQRGTFGSRELKQQEHARDRERFHRLPPPSVVSHLKGANDRSAAPTESNESDSPRDLLRSSPVDLPTKGTYE